MRKHPRHVLYDRREDMTHGRRFQKKRREYRSPAAVSGQGWQPTGSDRSPVLLTRREPRSTIYSRFSVGVPELAMDAFLSKQNCRGKAIAVLFASVLLTLDVSPLLAQRRGEAGGVYKARVTPQWFDGGTKFWYQN